MTAIPKLKDVACAPCLRAGHRCQAQMQLDEPVCLRCANEEPCYAVTAKALPTPARMIEQDLEAVFIPQISIHSRQRGRVRVMDELGKIADGAAYAEKYYTRKQDAA